MDSYKYEQRRRLIMAIHYVCSGSCGGSVTQEEYNDGKNTCAAEDCERYSQPLERKED